MGENIMKNTGTISKALITIFVFIFLLPVTAYAAGPSSLTGKKVLVVMSYHETYGSHRQVKKGIDSVLTDADIKYFYLNTKRDKAGGPARAKEAFILYQEYKPDLVIAAEDNAQSMFVVPYLKDKVKTPVVFTGVNDDATKYGYPASNITGILEKKHIREGLVLAQLIVPEIQKVAVIFTDNPSNQANIAQVQAEKSEYPVEIVELAEVRTMDELNITIKRLEKKADALFTMNMEGIIDQDGIPQDNSIIQLHISKICGKPTIGYSDWQVKNGALCGVIKLSREKGTIAAQMAVKILNGKSVKDMPITQNRNGRRIINVTTAKQLGISLSPIALRGTELVR